jgi:hypothetical protein
VKKKIIKKIYLYFIKIFLKKAIIVCTSKYELDISTKYFNKYNFVIENNKVSNKYININFKKLIKKKNNLKILFYSNISWKKNFEFYNIGTNEEFKNKDLIKLICGILHVSYKGLVTKVRDRVFNDARYSICHSKITKLGWSPQKKMNSDSLKEIFYWTKKNLNNFTR